MRTRDFGTTGWRLSAIGFGGVPLSFGQRPAEADAVALLHLAFDCGINVVDTANAYCRDSSEEGHNERLIGRALAKLPAAERNRIKVFTKGGYTRPGGAWRPDGRPEHLRAACEGSLRALGTERIDLYQHHTPDPDVPVAETVGEMARLQDEGKIEHIGVSNYSVEQIEAAAAITTIQSVQNEYSPRHRAPEEDGTLAHTAEKGMAFVPWSPLGGLGAAQSLAQRRGALAEISARLGVSPQRLALAWLLHQGEHVFPIPGASRPATLQDSAQAADLDLEPAVVERLARELR